MDFEYLGQLNYRPIPKLEQCIELAMEHFMEDMHK